MTEFRQKIPCKNPSLCGVRSHHPETDAECMKPTGKHAGAKPRAISSAPAQTLQSKNSATQYLLQGLDVGFVPSNSDSYIGTITKGKGPTAKVYDQDGILTIAVAVESKAINLDDYEGEESRITEAISKSYERVSALLVRGAGSRIAQDVRMMDRSSDRSEFGPGEAESIFLVAVSRRTDGIKSEGTYMTSASIFNNLASNPYTPGHLLHQMATGEGMSEPSEWKELGQEIIDSIIRNPNVEYRTLQRIKESGQSTRVGDLLNQKIKELKPKGFLRRLFG